MTAQARDDDPTFRPSRAFVSLIGAGPGDPGLLTLRGKAALEAADVVLYDYLAAGELLQFCPRAERIDVGKKGYSEYVSQEDINALMVLKAQQDGGKRVARLKGGDVFVFGRGGEEAQACRAAGVPFEVVPGVTSAIAAPAYAGIPVTHRGLASSFAVITGREKEGDALYGNLSGVDTLVLLMGVRNLDSVAQKLIDTGRSPATPAATVQWGTTSRQRVARGTLSTIAEEVARAGLEAPAVTVVGEVASLRDTLQWFDTSPLFGRTVVVTRTQERNSALADVLRLRGAQVVELPLIRHEKTGDPGTLYRALSQLHSFDWTLLTSQQAVHELFWHLEEMGQDARAFGRGRVAAVGPATARALEARGIRADFTPATPGAAHLGRELPARPGSRLLHLASHRAEDALEEALSARGLNVERVELYRTEPREPDEAALRALHSADVVTLASGSAARALAEVAGTKYRVAVMGPQTEKAAREAGFSAITLAREASLDALADAAAQVVTARFE
ncbi:uroporphyrinogen-III C-methyltransferase [Deinococcus peraridilitoris]|uniref:uroporphyrinogen-III C-methyltransferase n=1 Tax=Deinococcus peraridilitoris (strain DSM 19664 / LMG 22246 / CIP 109416 / KR-200) TaxID=937777 RepID=L0A252_DEIPD|nr:uroporphyrinogen-III C-methyltransferase [Deinococcus peraridilitoris]AFZ67926.1 uroporphyrin-III C-methyltransferase [Deinococcus peraridilitoris DSM 19664]